MKEFGKKYAIQVVRNAQTLAKALADSSLPVACSKLGFTRSHQVLLDYGSFRRSRAVARKLEKANVIADCGVRLGVCELTRRGMKRKEMLKVAEFIARALLGQEKPQRIKKEVEGFMLDFQEVQFCFN
jgi:glycine hydroxymethyltransferase